MTSLASKFNVDMPMWQIDASCQASDPTLFLGEERSSKRVTSAKKICESCPVLSECLPWILDIESKLGSQYGLYGGFTQYERRSMRVCRYGPCKELVKKLNTGKKAKNFYCSEEHKELQAKVSAHEARDSERQVQREYYMRGSIRNGKGSAGTY